MNAWLLTLIGVLATGYGGRALAAAEEPSWLGAAILPAGLVVLGLGLVGLLVPGFV